MPGFDAAPTAPAAPLPFACHCRCGKASQLLVLLLLPHALCDYSWWQHAPYTHMVDAECDYSWWQHAPYTPIVNAE